MRIERLFSLAVSILAGLLISGPVRAGAPADAAIEGVVVRADTGEPVAGARVVLTSMKRRQDDGYGGTFRPWRRQLGSDEPTGEGFALPSPDIATAWAVTDANGHFAMIGLVPDTYSLVAQADGFVIRFYGQKVLRTTGTPLNLTEGQSLSGIRFTLVGTGSLSGHISEGSDPAEGVWVRLLRDSFDEHGRRQTIHVGQAVTDDKGRYRFFWIPPGRYHLATGGPNFNDEPEDRPLRFYPDAFEPADADRFEIHSGEARTLDWNLPPLQRFHLRGRLIDSRTGKVPAAPSISFALRTSVQWLELERHGADIHYDSNTGQIEADDLNPGVYQVRWETDGGQNASTIVRITNADVEGVVLDAAENADGHFAPLQGKITVRGNSRLAFDKLNVEFFAVTRPPIIPNSPNYDVNEDVESDGTFEIDVNSDRSSDQDLIDGEEYVVAVHGLPQGWYVQEARLDGRSVLMARVLFHAGGQFSITLSPNAGQVEGLVRDAGGKQPARAQVVLIPAAEQAAVDRYQTAATDESGRFRFSSAAPGDYLAYAWEAIEPNAYFDDHLVSRFKNRGVAVHVSEKSRSDIALTLIPGTESELE